MKQAAVIALCTRRESAQAVAQELGVCRPTLYNWKNQLPGREVPASMKRQLEALRRDIRRLQLEQDLLKKANEILKKTWASTSNS